MPPPSAPGNAPAGPDSRIERGARILRGGGVIAYPNESVYGLGCLPDNEAAVEHILALKGRPRSMGMILVAAEWAQFGGWTGELAAMPKGRELLESRGVTWIVAAAPGTPDWISGARPSIAVRRSLHPLACALSKAVDSPLVSTSCNPHGSPPALSAKTARGYFGAGIDWVLDGQCGPLKGPTEIRDVATGEVLRPG